MSPRTALLRAWSHLLEWDVPFLPIVDVAESGTEVDVRARTPGVPLDRIRGWPRRARVAVAAQLVALACFLFDQGWYPSRRLLLGVRVSRQPHGLWVRLSRLPGRALQGAAVRRAYRRLAPGHHLLDGLLAPILAGLLPEGGLPATDSRGGHPAAELLRSLSRVPRVRDLWAHPGGTGRFLWGRRLAVPESGVVWVEDAENLLLEQLHVAARLASIVAGRRLAVASGRLDEPSISRIQTEAALQGMDCLVFTLIPVSGAAPLALADSEMAVWGTAPTGANHHVYQDAAGLCGGARAALAGEILAAGAREAFSALPEAAASGWSKRYEWLSPAAREVLTWLEQAPAGLAEGEFGHLVAGGPGAREELERLGLAWRDGAHWRAASAAGPVDVSLQARLASLLPESSPRKLLALALAGGDPGPLADWCEESLEQGLERAVQEHAGAVPRDVRLRLLAAEAALVRGRLRDAAQYLERAPDSPEDPSVGAAHSVGGSAERSPDLRGCPPSAESLHQRWRVLEAWRADLEGERARSVELLAGISLAEQPTRIADRATILTAENERRIGNVNGAGRLLRSVEEGDGRWACEAGLLRAALAGAPGLRRWRRAYPGGAPAPELLTRALYLRSAVAFERGSWSAVATGLRAALRRWQGESLLLLADVHSDLGTALAMMEHRAAAERHLQLAEQLYARCGSRRDRTVVRPNRAVLACDGLELDRAEELIDSARDVRGDVGDASYWLDEVELARVAVARGDLETVRTRLEQVAAGAISVGDHPRLMQSVAVVRSHLALAEGDLPKAELLAVGAEEGERRLVEAVAAAARGVQPGRSLPARWGMTVTATALAVLVRGDEDMALQGVQESMRRSPKEGAMGLARLAALAAAGGRPLSGRWNGVMGQAAATLGGAGMTGWQRYLRRGESDLAGIMTALGQVLESREPMTAAQGWEGLGRALGLTALAVSVDGRSIVTWGSGADHCAVNLAGLHIACSPAPGPGPAAVLDFVASRLPVGVNPEESREGAGRGSTLIGRSPALAEVRACIDKLAPLAVTVLILGEPGTGKELVAREFHRRSGRSGPWEAVNCAALPEGLLESELFGVVRGAYTGADRDRPGLVEATDGGTLFLDEIGELPLSLQAKLLRVLQHREVRRVGAAKTRTVDVRFLAATNRDLGAAVAAGRFRRDLFDRLSVFQLLLPPLRERPVDAAELAHVLVERFANEFHRPGVRLSGAAVALLSRQPWPGNVRELESALIRAVVSARPGETLEERHFKEFAQPVAAAPADQDGWLAAQHAFGRAYFSELLERAGNNRTRAAAAAGITRQALRYQLRRLGLDSGP